MHCDRSCISCIKKQAERTLDLISLSLERKKSIMKQVSSYLGGVDLSLSPMAISQGAYELLKEKTGENDFYYRLKISSNVQAQHLVEFAKKRIEASIDPLFTALKISISGNIIDYGVSDNHDLRRALDNSLKKHPSINDYSLLKRKLESANSLTLFLDNAGEAIFDKLLIDTLNDHLNLDKITVVAKKTPFLNDVTLKDIKKLSFAEVQNVQLESINNKEYKKYFHHAKKYLDHADVTLSKGQGNFELLFDHNPCVFFLFMVKCPYISRVTKTEIGATMLYYN